MSLLAGLGVGKLTETSKRSALELRARLECSLSAVEDFCNEFRSWYASACPSQKVFQPELLLREALANAVEHSLQAQATLQPEPILCVVRGSSRRILIAVRDPGPGFDWRAQLARPAEDLSIGGRGLAIYSRYAHRLRFLKKGNGVTLIRYFSADPPPATDKERTK